MIAKLSHVNKSASTLHFQRFEFKYVLDVEQYHKICARIQKYMALDPFVEKQGVGSYEVASLYFDSPKFYAYWEKIDGARKRKKMRLRTYRSGDTVADYSFFEIKRKFDAVVLKNRVMVDSDEYRSLMETGSFMGTDLYIKEHDVVEEFEYERCLRYLEPKVLILYKRDPYVGMYDSRVRVTFDYNIKAKRAEELFLDFDAPDFLDVSENKVIMELKFNDRLPPYIASIIQEYGLGRVPYSKYCESIESTYTLPLVSVLGGHSQSDSLRLDRNHLT